MKAGRAKHIAALLEAAYPAASTELVFSGEYQLIVAVILSAQCTDKKVNEVTPELFAHFPSFDTLAKARLPTLERIVRVVNYYRTKARNLREMARKVSSEFGGALPTSHEQLMTLPGVGRKTANVVLGELGAQATLPVDTHVFRVAHRLGLSSGKTPNQVEEDLMKLYPSSSWRALHHQLILHGRRVCKAQRPLCGSCTLSDVCPFFARAHKSSSTTIRENNS